MFAKLYETEVGQILVMLDSGDNGPEVQYHFEPKGLGVCNLSINFKDDDEDTAWDKVEKIFEACTQESAEEIVGGVLADFPSL
jgi:hypothetical protein